MTPDTLRAWIAGAGGRRFLMCMGAHFINAALFVFGVLSEDGYLITFGGTVAVYIGGVGWQKHVEAKKSA